MRNSRRDSENKINSYDKPGITNRGVSGNKNDSDKDDVNPSPTKKLRMVQFREQDSNTNEDENRNEEDNTSNGGTMNARRGILSFQVKDKE